MSERAPVLVGVFDDRMRAEEALRDLQAAGFADDELGFALRGSDVMQGGMITDTVGAKDARGAVAGAITGSMIGGIIGAAAALMVPGVGPVLAGGVLASFFGGAIAGTAVGGILGAMTGLGISEEEAQFYEKAFHEGKAIVAVRAGARAADAGEILHRHGGYNLQQRRESPLKPKALFRSHENAMKTNTKAPQSRTTTAPNGVTHRSQSPIRRGASTKQGRTDRPGFQENTMKRAAEDTLSLLVGAGLGMIAMYLLDPEAGTRRRRQLAAAAGEAATSAGEAVAPILHRAGEQASHLGSQLLSSGREALTDAADRAGDGAHSFGMITSTGSD